MLEHDRKMTNNIKNALRIYIFREKETEKLKEIFLFYGKLNNEMENLKLLCPNCHALTDNYRGKNINKDGTTILLVEQNAGKSLAISDRAYVLENGSIVLSGTGEELVSSDMVKEAYLGG